MNQNHGNITSIAIDEVFEPFLQSALCQSFGNYLVESHEFSDNTFDTDSCSRAIVPGLSRLPIQLNFCTSSGKQKADRFNLAVPYAGQTLSWTVMFNSTCPEIGPDFDFHNDSFMADPAIDTIENDIPSLAKWEPNNKDSLLKVLTELTLCYKQHQVSNKETSQCILDERLIKFHRIGKFMIHECSVKKYFLTFVSLDTWRNWFILIRSNSQQQFWNCCWENLIFFCF